MQSLTQIFVAHMKAQNCNILFPNIAHYHANYAKVKKKSFFVLWAQMRKVETFYSKLPHGLALKLSRQNPSASPVLEVAPLFPIGNFPMENFHIGEFTMSQSSFRSDTTFKTELAHREFPYNRKIMHRKIPYGGKCQSSFGKWRYSPIRNFPIENLFCDTLS